MSNRRRVHLFVHGRGRGHATRCATIGIRLEQSGYDVTATGGVGLCEVVEGKWDAELVESLPSEVSWRTASILAARVRQSIARLRRTDPKVVVSDGDLPGVLAARRLGIPVIAVGHGLTFAICAPPDGLDVPAWRREARKAKVASLGADRRVGVNFTPLRVRSKRAVLASPELAPMPPSTPAVGRVLCYFRDRADRGVLDALVRLQKDVSCFGCDGPDVRGVEFRSFDRGAFLSELARAEAVVASAGSQLISECISLGLPFFGVHAPGDDEQALNVAMLRHAGAGDGGPAGAIARDRLEAFLEMQPTRVHRPGPPVGAVVAELCDDLMG